VTHDFDESCLEQLLAALSACSDPAAGPSDLTLCEGLAELRFRRLDGRAVCAAMTIDDVLWVVVDPGKTNALGQARAMLGEWRRPTSSRKRPTLAD